MRTELKLPQELEKKVLLGLYKYYTNDVTFERAAEDANIPIILFVNYVNDNNLPIVHTEKDVTDGLNRVVSLMQKNGINISKLKLSS